MPPVRFFSTGRSLFAAIVDFFHPRNLVRLSRLRPMPSSLSTTGMLILVIALRLRSGSLVSSILSATGLLIRSLLSAYFRALFFRPFQEQSRFAPGAFRRFACVVVVTVMMINSVVASPQISHSVVDFASVATVNSWQSLSFRWHASGWAEKSSRFAREHFHLGGTAPQRGWDGKGAPERPVPEPEPQETQEQRNARIVRVDLFPKEAKIRTNEPLILNAIAYDKDDNPISGVNFDWSAYDEDRGKSVGMAAKGKFVATTEGKHEVR